MSVKSEGIIKDAYETVIKEIQSIVTVFYISAIGVGMLFNYHKYSGYGIDIFDYADLLDFLLTPFSDINVLLFTIISMLIAFTAFKFDSIIKDKFPKFYSRQCFGLNKYKWHNIARNVFYLCLFLAYLFISSVKYGEFNRAKIAEKPIIYITYSDNEITSGKMIGKTREAIFILSDDKVRIIPVAGLIKGIELK